MTRILLTTSAIALLGLASSILADERVERLPPADRAWLEEEVVYIITDIERDVFLTLETIEERSRFKEAFWRKRDPNPATSVNEYQEEHYERIAYANQFLGRETNREGWETDRGRHYIILGEPRQIERYDSDPDLVESELWFYQGETEKGLPSAFFLIFFKRKDVGEYRLYHPMADGPTSLLRSTQGLAGAQNADAVELLGRISHELARASLSPNPRDAADLVGGQPALGVDILLANIEESPKRAIRSDYADAHLRYGDRISTEYSFNYFPNSSYFAVLSGPEQTPFVHYSLELAASDFSLETNEDQTSFYTTLDVSLEVRDTEGKILAINNKTLPLQLSPSQVAGIGSKPVVYQDNFPIMPGDCTMSVILRNRVLRQYTVAEQELRVEDFSTGKPMLSDVILGYAQEVAGGFPPDEHRTFQVGSTHIGVATNRTFVLGETVYVFAQAVDADADHQLRFSLEDQGRTLQSWQSSVGSYLSGPILEQFALTDMSGGTYDVRIELLDAGGQSLFERSTPISVSPRTSIERPGFVYRRGFNPKVPGLLALARGEQLWARGERVRAVAELEAAVAARNPQLPMADWRLAGALIQSGEPDRALSLLLPLESAHPTQYEVITGIGFAYHQKQNFEQAADYLARAAAIRPPDTTHWNVLADSYQKLGKVDEAKDAFERSLQLDPDQDKVKQQLATLDAP